MDLVGQGLGVLIGVASWFFLIRRRLNQLDKLRSGDSDDCLFQAHFRLPVEGGDDVVLLFRNIAPSSTISELYDKQAARKFVADLAEQTTVQSPILKTTGSIGFEVLNIAFGHVAGSLVNNPFPREQWLFAMTCEDRQVVRKECVRCFLIRPADLEKFLDWDWRQQRVRCERPWNWYRIVALHQIACYWAEERKRAEENAQWYSAAPLIDDQARHLRVRTMSAGLYTDELPVGQPASVSWERRGTELRELGLDLSSSSG